MRFFLILFITLLYFTHDWGYTLSFKPLTKEEVRIQQAATILEEIATMPEKGLPRWVVQEAQALVIVPNLVKAGLLVGGEHGKGIVIIRDESGHWSDPVFMDLTAGSFGFQAGVQSADVVLVFKRRNSLSGMGKSKLALGGDLSIAAGPIGRHSSASTDGKLQAEIYSYSRSRGLFAGVSLEGAILSVSQNANKDFYGQRVIVPDEVFSGRIQSENNVIAVLRQTLAKLEKEGS